MTQLLIGDWQVDFNSGACVRISSAGSGQRSEIRRLEPKSCQLLHFLAQQPGQLVSKEQLITQVWPETYATDDTLARTLSRLRTNLDDNAKNPQYIETVPKRGYILIASVSNISPSTTQAVERAAANGTADSKNITLRRFNRAQVIIVGIVLAALLGYFWLSPAPTQPAKDLLSRADDYYHQMRLADNEMAIALYQQHLALHPNAAEAYAGLANSLVQKTLRWSGAGDNSATTLTGKVAAGALANEASQQQLQRAHALAQQAVALQPDNATTLKALGFVLSAQGNFTEAIAVYQRALRSDPQAWQVQLNIGELYQAMDAMPLALQAYEAAFNAMTQRYQQQEVQIRPWIADVGSLLGDHYLASSDYQTAESWYRRVLTLAPLHEDATLGLAKVLHATGDSSSALQLCRQLNQRLQKNHQC